MSTRTRITPILALIFGVLGLAIGELIKLWQNDANPLLSAGLSVAGGTLPLIIDYLKNVGGQEHDRPAGPRTYHPVIRPSRGRPTTGIHRHHAAPAAADGCWSLS